MDEIYAAHVSTRPPGGLLEHPVFRGMMPVRLLKHAAFRVLMPLTAVSFLFSTMFAFGFRAASCLFSITMVGVLASVPRVVCIDTGCIQAGGVEAEEGWLGQPF